MTDEQIKILRLPTSRIEVASIDGFDATWKSFQESFNASSSSVLPIS